MRPRIGLKGTSEAARHLVLVRDAIVNFYIALVAVISLRSQLNCIAGQIVIDRRRVKRRSKQGRRHRTDHVGRNDVTEERWTCTVGGYRWGGASSVSAWVIKLIRRICANSADETFGAKSTEIAALFGLGENRDEASGGRMVEALALIVHEEEQLVLVNRSAKGATEHVPAQRSAGKRWASGVDLVFPLVGVQHVIAEIFPDIAVEAVGSRLN